MSDTGRKLAELTDAAQFEELVMAVLRNANTSYSSLIHLGINAAGKTVKTPLDGITFVNEDGVLHFIAVHHTTCKREDLEGKWLHDPSSVTPKRNKPTQPAGDLIKTVGVFKAQKDQFPGLKGTLVLTTNEEPPLDVVSKVHAAGTAVGLNIDIWGRGRLADFLDLTAHGQWIRRERLGIEQGRLSWDLLRKLSEDSLNYHRPLSDSNQWIDCELDRTLTNLSGSEVNFVVGDSGLGKSVACWKRLRAHLDAGGVGLILPHQILEHEISLDQAIDATLRQLHPKLALGEGAEARKLTSADRPLLLVCEDLNKSAQTSLLIERLAGWNQPKKPESGGRPSWQVLCPIWPKLLTTLSETLRKNITELKVRVPRFTAAEGLAAVQKRYASLNRGVTDLDATAIAEALGYDPLLIALHEPSSESADPSGVITQFVAGSVNRAVARYKSNVGAEYTRALHDLASAMLIHKQMSPKWTDLAKWPELSQETLGRLSHIANQGEIFRIAGDGLEELLAFRHDRVRDQLLINALSEGISRKVAHEDVLSDCYYAEIIGTALAHSVVDAETIRTVQDLNPLALFYALRMFREVSSDTDRLVIAAIDGWLADKKTHAEHNDRLRWEALRALSETDSSLVLSIVSRFHDGGWMAQRARFRNGDVGGGIELCSRLEPGTQMDGHKELIQHVLSRFGPKGVAVLDSYLRKSDIPTGGRIGALRLAGHFAAPNLEAAIQVSWEIDPDRANHLDDYLWASAECLSDGTPGVLELVCDAWAALPEARSDERLGLPSPRNELAAHNIRWAFSRKLPRSAVRYFIRRADDASLNWPITYLLGSVDDPEAIEFIVRRLANRNENFEAKGGFDPFAMHVRDEWKRRQENSGRGMSSPSRDRLLTLWRQTTNSKFVRRHALRLWMSNVTSTDLPILSAIEEADDLFEWALPGRLTRGDHSAIPAWLKKIQSEKEAYWWQFGRYIWSPELTVALDEALPGGADRKDGKRKDVDWILSEMLMRLPIEEAERLLLKHWAYLNANPQYVQAALYTATPDLIRLVQEVMRDSLTPEKLLEHITMHFGCRTPEHPGITRKSQIEALVSYLDLLEDGDIDQFWSVCNDHAWFDLRRKYFDPLLKAANHRDAAFFNKAKAFDALDEMMPRLPTWIDHWLDDYRETGASVDQIIDLMVQWLRDRKKTKAFEMVVSSIMHMGERRHFDLLAGITTELPEAAEAILQNGLFAVQRRSLC